MQIRKERMAFGQQFNFPGLRLFDLDDQLRAFEHFFRGFDDVRTRAPVILVIKADGASGSRAVNSRTLAGVIPTRYSSALISRGTPIFIRLSRAWVFDPVELRISRCSFVTHPR